MKIKKIDIFWPVTIAVYFVSRLINLKAIPIFTDEAIYSYWAQIALHDPANRFVSLEDGKQPLFIWFAAIFQQLIEDPLIASRYVSVFSGFFSVIGIYLLAKTIFDSKIAKIASILYVVLPFTLLYDRMALFDSLLTMLGIYAVFFTVKVAQSPRLDLAIINGFVIGMAMITKSSGNFFLYLLPLSAILIGDKLKNLSYLSRWIIFSTLSAFISFIIYNLLRLSPLFYVIDRKNHEFILTFNELINNPFAYFLNNSRALITWFIEYNGPFLFIFLLAVLLIGLLGKKLKIIFLSIYFVVPFLAEAIFNKVLYPRFMLFYFPYIIILISYGFSQASQKINRYLLVVICITALLVPIFSSVKLLTDPPNSKIPTSDKEQYINSWPAGYGVDEVVEILKKESSKESIFVGTEGTFGLFPFALNIYFYANKNIQIKGYWPVDKIPQEVIVESRTKPTFFVFNEHLNYPESLKGVNSTLIGEYQKGSGNSFMRIYRINP